MDLLYQVCFCVFFSQRLGQEVHEVLTSWRGWAVDLALAIFDRCHCKGVECLDIFYCFLVEKTVEREPSGQEVEERGPGRCGNLVIDVSMADVVNTSFYLLTIANTRVLLSIRSGAVRCSAD